MIKQSLVKRELGRISLGNVSETLSDYAMKLVRGGSGGGVDSRVRLRCTNGNSFLVYLDLGGCLQPVIETFCNGTGHCEALIHG